MNATLLQLRKEKGLSQAKLAAKAGINRTTYVNVEQGRTPELSTALSIAKVLEIDSLEKLQAIFLPQNVDMFVEATLTIRHNERGGNKCHETRNQM